MTNGSSDKAIRVTHLLMLIHLNLKSAGRLLDYNSTKLMKESSRMEWANS